MKNLAKKKKTGQEVDLIWAILEAKRELNNANRNFEIAEGGLIDYYSYKIKADKAKLDYLIRKVKTQNLEMSMINNLEILTCKTERI